MNSISAQYNLKAILEKVSACVREETEAIRTSRRDFDIGASNARKERLLYELNRASRIVEPSKLDDDCLDCLRRLKRDLVANAKLIQAHMSAVQEVADTMIDVLRNEGVDGTYSMQQFGAGG